jgi:DNA adenine methylase
MTPRRLIHYTPLRYPGGKAKLAAYIKALIKTNRMFDGHYVEPYCGGASIGLELLFHEYVTQIHINDLSKPIYAFWKSVLNHTEKLCMLIRDTPLTVRSWDKQKRIFMNQKEATLIELGFAAFFLNRTNRSGIFNAGVIGGRDQTGTWKIDARFNREELIFRIESIAKLRNRIHLTKMDALKFLRTKADGWPDKTLIYLDPPYFEKSRDLYYDFYEPDDHEQIYQFLTKEFSRRRWVVSYDNVEAIRQLYRNRQRLVYQIAYSAREARKGSEVMFFSDGLQKSPLIGSLKLLERFS